jgi:HNH endonuclease
LIFDFTPLDDDTLLEIQEIEMERASWRRKEALQLFYTLRTDFSDAFSDLEIVVLKPLCASCADRYSIPPPGFGLSDEPAMVAVLPGYRPGQFRMYDMSDHHLHFFPYERDGDSEEDDRIYCSHCGDRNDEGDVDGDEIIAVEPVSFCEYFGVEDEGPKKAGGDLREEIRELYGRRCFACGSTKDLRIDHIMPKSAEGLGIPTNLQVLCDKCNGEKADKLPAKLVLALDFLMRPAPWETYEGLIW